MYSKAEWMVIRHFTFLDLIDRVEPLMLYRMMIERAFELNDQSKYTAALRCGWFALKGGKTYTAHG
jgi:hypothetical protein